jgi:pimeloyl-ACP methyl ester carboxylesterase
MTSGMSLGHTRHDRERWCRATVYNYDRRGRGESGDTPPYAIEREIEDLDAVIAGAGGSASVFGHSSGAALALHAAAHGLATGAGADPRAVLRRT